MSNPCTAASPMALVAEVDREFRAFVENPRFSCLAAQGVVHSGRYTIGVYASVGSQEINSTDRLARDLAAFITEPDADTDAGFRSFVAVFPDDAPADEIEFERRLWQQLQLLHERESPDTPWDQTVSDDPEDPRFAFSFAGRALFVVGLHPESSRIARRFRWPTLVFNPHEQFERLRARGKFERLRAMRSASARSRCRAASIPTSPISARRPTRGSIRDARSSRIGNVPFTIANT